MTLPTVLVVVGKILIRLQLQLHACSLIDISSGESNLASASASDCRIDLQKLQHFGAMCVTVLAYFNLFFNLTTTRRLLCPLCADDGQVCASCRPQARARLHSEAYTRRVGGEDSSRPEHLVTPSLDGEMAVVVQMYGSGN